VDPPKLLVTHREGYDGSALEADSFFPPIRLEQPVEAEILFLPGNDARKSLDSLQDQLGNPKKKV
jgi:hypothetical protein